MAPIREVYVPAPSPSSQAKYSGPPIPHKPGQPSADENPSSEVITSTMSSGMVLLLRSSPATLHEEDTGYNQQRASHRGRCRVWSLPPSSGVTRHDASAVRAGSEQTRSIRCGVSRKITSASKVCL